MKRCLTPILLLFIISSMVHAQSDKGMQRLSIDTSITWEAQQLPTNEILWGMLRFVNSDTGWVGGANYSYVTTNGGHKWDTLRVPQHLPFYIRDERTYFAYTGDSMLKSTDAGLHWYGGPVPIQHGPTQLFEFGNGDTIYSHGAVEFAQSYDAGLTWKYHDLNGFIDRMSWSNSRVGLFLSDQLVNFPTGIPNMWIQSSNLQFTTDGGASWKLVCDSIYDLLNDGVMLTSRIAIVVGGDGGIGRTTDLGDTWTRTYNASDSQLIGVAFANPAVGYVVGEAGMILRTADSGKHWVTQTRVTTRNLWRVYFLNDSVGFVSGDSGTVLRTVNGGASWVETSTSDHLHVHVYPDPAVSSVSINYFLPDASSVSLQISNEQGIAVLQPTVTGILGAGEHSLSVPISVLPAGHYFYTISTHAATQTGKFAVVR